jgi:hypothetical protein
MLSHERRARRHNILLFIRRTIVLSLLLVPFARMEYSYGYHGIWKETYIFGIRVVGVQR